MLEEELSRKKAYTHDRLHSLTFARTHTYSQVRFHTRTLTHTNACTHTCLQARTLARPHARLHERTLALKHSLTPARLYALTHFEKVSRFQNRLFSCTFTRMQPFESWNAHIVSLVPPALVRTHPYTHILHECKFGGKHACTHNSTHACMHTILQAYMLTRRKLSCSYMCMHAPLHKLTLASLHA
jgi:hypothetical protein